MKQRLLCFLLAGCLLLNCVLTARADDATVVDSGECGDSVTWTLDSDGLLKIEGSGTMANQQNDGSAWGGRLDDIKAAQIEQGVSSIGNFAFWNCRYLKSVDIPDTVESIGASAFCSCEALESIVIPGSVSSIQGDTFISCSSLTDITVAAENPNYSSLDGALFDKQQTTLIQYPIGKADTSYTIPDGVTDIGDSAFAYSILESVTIPDGVASIGFFAFARCGNLESVAIPTNVTLIDDATFNDCGALTSVVIPDSVTSIGNDAFCGCSALADVYYGGTKAQWDAVTVGENNEPLTEATLYYNSTGEYVEGAQRTVTFDAAGGTVEPTEKAVTAGQAYGELPEPAREHYAFAGWHTTRNGGTEVSADDTALLSGDVTLYAHWTPLPYTVTWADEDGTVLQTAEVPYGQTPVYSGETPVKDEDELFLYVFAGWTPEVGPVGGDTAYTVRYDSVSKFCTVTWYNYNGEVLETDENVPLGETPEYNGETPERLPAGANAYVFAGWTPEVVAVSGDAAYMATYEAAPRTLTVTWVDEDGTVLETDEVSYGETPVYNGEAPVKATDERYDYEFSGWKTLPRPIRDDMTYEAAYTPTPKKYTITWLDEDDTPLGTTQVQYGRVPAYDGERPRREAGEKPYIFAGWTPKPEPVSGEATYKARYRPSVSASIESVAIEDGAVNVTLDCSEADASLLCAIYNKNDRLITLASLPVGEEKLYSFRFDGHEFEYAKVFAIDANARALCASVKCEKTPGPLPEIE